MTHVYYTRFDESEAQTDVIPKFHDKAISFPGSPLNSRPDRPCVTHSATPSLRPVENYGWVGEPDL